MRGGMIVTPSKPVKRHTGPFYWLTRDVASGIVAHPSPPRAGFQVHELFGWPGFCNLPTHTFRVAGVLYFTYTNFWAAGVVHFTSTHTFRASGILYFTYTHFSGGRGFAIKVFLHIQTFGRILKQN